MGLLGPLRVVGDDGVELVVGAPRSGRCWAVGAAGSRGGGDGELVAALWGRSASFGDEDPAELCVRRCAGCFGSEAIETVAGGYWLGVGAEQVDSDRFEGLVGPGSAGPGAD